MPGGAVSPHALPWGDPDSLLLLMHTTRIKARLLSTGTWSALADAHFLPSPLAPPTLDWTVSPLDGRPQFWFNAAPGETYEVQYSPDPVASGWHHLIRFENAAGGLQSLPELPDFEGTALLLRVLWLPTNP